MQVIENTMYSPKSSMTRLGEISPVGQKLTNIWQIFDGLFFTWQIAQSTLANL